MGKWKRILKHLVSGRWQVYRVLPPSAMRNIEAAIMESERLHEGELRFAVEHGLDWPHLWRGVSARARAIEVFSRLRVWDTEQNAGVLIYLLLADRRVEIVADRGIHARVSDAGWQAICRRMEACFRRGDFEQGVIEGLREITALLQQHFPVQDDRHVNEMSDAPVVL